MARRMTTPVLVALIGAGGLVVGGLITMVSPPVQQWLVRVFAAKPLPPAPRKLKASLCNDPRTNQPYQYDIDSFYPQSHVDMNQPFGGDAANPGHKWNVKSEAPGIVLRASCAHAGASEEITYCGPLRSALGQPTKTAEIEGWLNGGGGPTTMTVFYQMPCEVPDDSAQ